MTDTLIRRFAGFLLAAAFLCGAAAWAQSAKPEPHIGYLYPAGGQQGATFQLSAGGQRLKGVNDVHVSGEGVHASVIRHIPRLNLKGEQVRELQKRVTRLWKLRQAELAGKPAPPEAAAAPEAEPVMLPDHPLLENLEGKSLRELAFLRSEFTNFRKKQQNAQIAETLLIQVEIAPDAPPGDRELRLKGPQGITNPLCFQVGLLPEIRETELNDPHVDVPLPEAELLDLPVLLNGQILPGDVDRFRLRAKQGQRLVFETEARSLIPYLADAVPGWFQATLALYDANGKEVAFADDYRFDPDPVLCYEIPEDGIYDLEIRDSIYRGREDFVYRVAVGELPFITQIFPLGGPVGAETLASADGWNLHATTVSLDTRPGDDFVRQTALRGNNGLSNNVTYAVDALPECTEDEQSIELPRIVNGRIEKPGDVDVFSFEGRAGEEVVAEVCGRMLHSPLDSVLRLTNAAGAVIEWNDDRLEKDGHLYKGPGLLTHHADSYLRARLPEDGVYAVQVTDAQQHGGQAYAYRLRVGPPRPDFALRMTPSSLSVSAGRAVAITAYASRLDGFEGDIELVLKDAPAGFALNGARIPAGRDSIRVTLTAPVERPENPIVLRLEGRALIGGQTVSRPVVPAEDMMQAFLYRHLVPSQELVVAVTGSKRGGRSIDLISALPIQIPAGGEAEVQVRTPKAAALADVRLELDEPPSGITLQDVQVVPEGLAFVLKADGEAAKPGLVDNLILQGFTEKAPKPQEGKPAQPPQRVSLGVLPAIPIEVVPKP